MPHPHGELLILDAGSAVDLMSPNPISVAGDATLQEAEALLSDREISAAPVIDEAGRPIGVLSRTDILRYYRTAGDYLPGSGGYADSELAATRPSSPTELELAAKTRVLQVMTPTVLSVRPETSALEVVAQLLAIKVHRLFVIDQAGVLVGTISMMDVLRKLKRQQG